MISASTILLIIAGAIIIISYKSLVFLNILSIMKDYYIFLFEHHLINLFVFVPCLLSVSICLKTDLNNNTIDNLMIILVLLITVYYSYFSFYSERDYTKETDQKKYSDKTESAKQCSLIISYNILIGVVSLILCLISYDNIYNLYFKFLLTVLIYFTFIQSLFNFMIILKRNYKMK